MQAIASGAILTADGMLLAIVSGPGFAVGSYVKGANLVRWVDLAVLGWRRYLPHPLRVPGGRRSEAQVGDKFVQFG
ncbi:MAG: hypothetical protein HZA93_26475 [Verrucomicrobia bacterium]|nr:hypothetical protein [Verrucomicrobiota bacterium]